MAATLLIATTALSASAAPPTFPSDYYSGTQDDVLLNQGGVYVDGGACCNTQTGSGQCKVQTQSSGGDLYEEGTKNRTRTDSPVAGQVVTWYEPVGKQMAIEPGSAGNSTHAFVCAQYCPQQGDFVSSVRIGDGKTTGFDKVRDMGQEIVTQTGAPAGTTKTCEKYRWTETVLKVVPMQTTNFYVDQSATPPVPFYSNTNISPLGKHIGTENQSFIDFTPGNQDANFDIDPASIASCPESDNCEDAPPSSLGSAASRTWRVRPSLLQEATRRARAALAAGATPAPPMPALRDAPVFDVSYTTDENTVMLINQGGHADGNGNVCCYSGATQCQVQSQHTQGTRYMDFPNNRSRFEDALADTVRVDDYNVMKSMIVNTTAGVDTCQEYCPLGPSDFLDPLAVYPNATDVGPTTIMGRVAEHYHWSDTVLKVIKMSTTDFYADTSVPTAAVPIYATVAITPFGGAQIGSQNQTWQNWKSGPPDSAKFKIAGVDACPRSRQCAEPEWQAHRLASRQYRTWQSYHKDF